MTHDEKVRETSIVRGIAASIQAMHMPLFDNLKELLAKWGWNLTRSTNKQTGND